MRKLIKDFIEICTKTLSISEPILEFGSLQVPGQEGFADLRSFFPGKEYVGVDMREGPGVDMILNLHHIDLPSESVGTVLMLDTLEHVEYPRKAIRNVERILKPEGILIISSVMNFPIHEFPYDYWRFTPEAFKSLFRPFNFSFVESVGKPEFPHTIVGIAFKKPNSKESLQLFMNEFETWKERWTEKAQPLWKRFIKSLLPPIIIDVYGRIRNSRT